MRNEKQQDKEKNIKQTESFAAAFAFAFAVLFNAPVDLYLSNIRDMAFSFEYILYPALVFAVAAVTLLYVILYFTKGKLHDIITDIIMGLSLAFYFQGNFLQMSAGSLDGGIYSAGIGEIIINLLIWIILAAVPFAARRFMRPRADTVPLFVFCLIFVMGAVSDVTMMLNITAQDDTGILADALTGNMPDMFLSSQEEFSMSEDHNFVIIIADEYDSFAFDDSLANYPDSAEELKDFTYYRDTLGMYGYSDPAIDNIFSGKLREDTEYSRQFFETLKANDYHIELYSDIGIFPDEIYRDFAVNYFSYDVQLSDILRIDSCVYRLSYFKYMPVILKPAFFMTSGDVTKNLSSNLTYYPDNLSFYNSIPDSAEKKSGNTFKFIYLYGLHDPRNITKDLERAPDWSISPEEQAVAVNKIMSKYVLFLKNNGVYDNSDIIILADHGVKSHDKGRFPLLLIKRAGERHDALEISEKQVSYADVFPTINYLAGGSEENTIFTLGEGDRKRYFADLDEWTEGPVK